MNAIKLILGGIVAVLSAIGLTVVLFGILAIAEISRQQKAAGLGAVAGGFSMLLHSLWFWLAVFVSFAIGLFLSYRKLYL